MTLPAIIFTELGKPIFEYWETKLWTNSSPEPNSGCYLWLGAVAGDGYGVLALGRGISRQLGLNYHMDYVHRISYQIHVGPIPEDHMVHHKCETHCCWNWLHLEPRLQSWHMLQHVNADAGNFCKNGHDRSIYGHVLPSDSIQCRECNRLNMQRYHTRRRGE